MSIHAPENRFFHPQLEPLEARECPAFNIYYYSSVLLIRGHPTLPFVNPGDGLQLQLLAIGLGASLPFKLVHCDHYARAHCT